MKKKKTIELTKDGYRCVFSFDEDRDIQVEVFNGDKLVMDWGYPKVAGNSLIGNAMVWLGQAVIQAKHEETNETIQN